MRRFLPENAPLILKGVFIVCATVVLIFLGIGIRNAWIASRSEKPLDRGQPTIVIRDPIPPSQLPVGWNAGKPPQQVIVTPVSWPTQTGPNGVEVVYIRDTIRVPVPSAIAEDSTIRITPDQPVTVHRPWIGSSSVSVATYNPRTQSYETLRYRVGEHPFKYGGSLEAYYGAGVSNPSFVGGGIEGYVGYGPVIPFARLDLDTENGVTGRAGIRYRLGR